MPLIKTTCGYCGEDIERNVYPSRVKRRRGTKYFCDGRCAARARWSGHQAERRQFIRVPPEHPLAQGRAKGTSQRGNLRVLVYRVALFDKIGAGPHPCHWCGDSVDWAPAKKGRGCHLGVLAVDHLDGNPKNNDPDNLVPACNDCNAIRGRARAWQQRTGKPLVELLG